MSLSELDELIYYTNIKLAEEIAIKDPKYLILNYKEFSQYIFNCDQIKDIIGEEVPLLHYAAYHDNLILAKNLIDIYKRLNILEQKINELDVKLRSPLKVASMFGESIAVSHLLMENGANPNYEENLLLDLIVKEKYNFVKLYLTNKNFTVYRPYDGLLIELIDYVNTPYEIIELIIKADHRVVNDRYEFSETSLLCAFLKQDIALINLLIDNGGLLPKYILDGNQMYNSKLIKFKSSLNKLVDDDKINAYLKKINLI